MKGFEGIIANHGSDVLCCLRPVSDQFRNRGDRLLPEEKEKLLEFATTVLSDFDWLSRAIGTVPVAERIAAQISFMNYLVDKTPASYTSLEIEYKDGRWTVWLAPVARIILSLSGTDGIKAERIICDGKEKALA